MDAFLRAIQRIRSIKIDEELRPSFERTMVKFSHFFAQHPEIRVDFDKLFDKYLYNNVCIRFGTPYEFSDDCLGYYSAKDNIINIKNTSTKGGNLDKSRQDSVLMHEFIHFIIFSLYDNTNEYNQSVIANGENPIDEETQKLIKYHNLPLWANEMLTEYWTQIISYGSFVKPSYKKLVTMYDEISKNIQEAQPATFFNGEADEIIKNYNLSAIDETLLLLIEDTKQNDCKNNSLDTDISRHYLYLLGKKLANNKISNIEYMKSIFNTKLPIPIANDLNSDRLNLVTNYLRNSASNPKNIAECTDKLLALQALNFIWSVKKFECDSPYIIKIDDYTIILAPRTIGELRYCTVLVTPQGDLYYTNQVNENQGLSINRLDNYTNKTKISSKITDKSNHMDKTRIQFGNVIFGFENNSTEIRIFDNPDKNEIAITHFVGDMNEIAQQIDQIISPTSSQQTTINANADNGNITFNTEICTAVKRAMLGNGIIRKSGKITFLPAKNNSYRINSDSKRYDNYIKLINRFAEITNSKIVFGYPLGVSAINNIDTLDTKPHYSNNISDNNKKRYDSICHDTIMVAMRENSNPKIGYQMNIVAQNGQIEPVCIANALLCKSEILALNLNWENMSKTFVEIAETKQEYGQNTAIKI